MFSRMIRIAFRGTVVGCLGVTAAACNIDRLWAHRRVPLGPVTSLPSSEDPKSSGAGVDISMVDPQEVDLVEGVLHHRAEYHHGLQLLRDYYAARGYATKQSWAEFELKGLRSVKPFRYVMEAEIPSIALRPVEQIDEADSLYEQGLLLMRRGGHGIPGFFRRDLMIQAARTLRDLIEQFPTSDKIDDAAFYCGEIHKDYLPAQDTIAVRWYERAWTWNPETPHPARFQAAVVFDYRLQDRDRALELYQNVLEHELDKSNQRAAARRINELTTEARRARAGPS